MATFDIDIKKALGAEGAPFIHKFACHKEDFFQGAEDGMTVVCSASVKGQQEPMEGSLKYMRLKETPCLQGYLTQWQPTQDPLFASHEVKAGWIRILRASDRLDLEWNGKLRSLDAYCVNTMLGGTDSEGDVWTIDLHMFRLF